MSLLPQFSKILEKLFCKRLVDFIENNAILSKSQYGFRQKHSTSFAIMELVEEITSATDSKKSTIGVFIDLKKAFDTINHSILLKKLNHYGIRGISNDWLNSYMRDRHQFVNYNDVNSEMLKIVCGVPQGSILGPILFILYINDLCKVSETLKFVLFADDTNLFASGTDLKQLCDVINEELIKINAWFRVNKLSLNVSKTNFMIFSNKHLDHNNPINLTIDGTNIVQVFETKFLGVMIDHKLNWKSHIMNIRAKLSRCIGMFYKASQILDVDSLRMLYCLLYLPHISYCNEIWGTAYKSNIDCINKSQKRVIRIICKASKFCHTTPLFSKLKLLKFNDLVNCNIASLMFRVSKKDVPLNIQKYFSLNHGNYGLRHSDKFQVKFVRTTRKSQCLSAYGVKLYNDLDQSLKQTKALGRFKKLLKRRLISKYET